MSAATPRRWRITNVLILPGLAQNARRRAALEAASGCKAIRRGRLNLLAVAVRHA
ncbi:hypothetical protein SAMN02745857_03867 [Andreprevotia lacus DSM 23236]|jgi:hypothetical protein|uniref:Uncharacterized protein n=1 Tax=Andreprevotia lacus DSM 23236 TaxID=1121001 RepID=A0A1W1XZT9_9NEIS|nr:hypothetical protein [Andreprevotia lacus]SMC29480.1 hypothetical protein SAMN02745857_03867 [Andreprevotia lacus DSM 23236]